MVKMCLKNSYSEVHGIPTNGLVVDTRSLADSPRDVTSTKRFSFFTSWRTPRSLHERLIRNRVIPVLPLYLSVHLNAKIRGRYHYLHMLHLLYVGIFLRAELPISIFAIYVYNSDRSLCEFRFSSSFLFSSRFKVR